jgi:hypothetical protein
MGGDPEKGLGPRPVFLYDQPHDNRTDSMGVKKDLPVIGWREWVALNDLKIDPIKAKVDTGARTSCLHAFDLEFFRKAGKEYVRFKVHPKQRSAEKTISCQAKVLEYRRVKSSNGKSERRPVILTQVKLMGQSWPIEVTLTNRDEMGFRMLLGRESIKKRFIVDVSRSYCADRLNKKITQ